MVRNYVLANLSLILWDVIQPPRTDGWSTNRFAAILQEHPIVIECKLPLYVLIVLIAFVFGLPIGTHYFPDVRWSDWVNTIILAISACIALVTYLGNVQREDSSRMLKHASDLLRQAYETFTRTHLTDPNSWDQKSDFPNPQNWPPNNKIVWLTTARLLVASNHAQRKITERIHRHIIQGIREFWRHKFYETLFPTGRISESFPAKYYAGFSSSTELEQQSQRPIHAINTTFSHRILPGRNDPEHLDETSVAVLYRFTRFSENKEDHLNGIPNFSEDEIHKMEIFGPRGLGRLIRAGRIWDKNP